MWKRRILGVAMFAVFAFGAVAVSSALALSSVWLVNGALAPLTLVTSESLGVVLIEDMSNSTPAMINCEEVLDEGWVGPGSEAEVTSVVFMKKCSVPAKAENLKKEEVSNSCKSGTEATFTPLNLPWKTLIVLVGAVFLDQLTAAGTGPGYKVECTNILGGKSTDECTTQKGTTELTNEGASAVLSEFPAAPAESEFANCTIGGELQGLVTGDVDIFAPAGDTLAVSEG